MFKKNCFFSRLFYLVFALMMSTGSWQCSDNDKFSDLSGVNPDLDSNNIPQDPMLVYLLSDSELNLGLLETKLIRAKVVLENGAPASGQRVSFRLDGVPGGAAMEKSTVIIPANGEIQNQLTAGRYRADFKVAIDDEAISNPAMINVNVDGEYRGKLTVRFSYKDLIKLGQITVRLHKLSRGCEGVNPIQPPPELTTTLVARSSQFSIFESLTDQEVYTVTATAEGPRGDIVASGCNVAPPIKGNSTVSTIVTLKVQPQNFEGIYDFSTKLHTSETLPGDIGETIDELNQFFKDPANMVGEALTEAMGLSNDAVNALLIFLLKLEDKDKDKLVIDEFLTEYALDKMPEWAQNGLLASGDLTDLVRNLTVGGELEIERVNDDQLEGHWQWGDFVFHWRAGRDCDFDDTCCGMFPYTAAEIGMAPAGADLLGSLVNRNRSNKIEYDLDIAEHRIDLQYGTLLYFGIEQIALPTITGESDLASAMELLFGCENIENSDNIEICGCERVGHWLNDVFSLGGFGTTLCQSVLTDTAEQFKQKIVDWTWSGTDSSYFTMSIDAVVNDSDFDLQTDTIVGRSFGNLYVGEKPAAFSGDLRGALEWKNCSADSDCADAESCQLKIDVLTQCGGENVCGMKVGKRVAGQSCSANTQCVSGLCLYRGSSRATCYTACKVDNDCPARLTCKEDAFKVKLSRDASAVVDGCVR